MCQKNLEWCRKWCRNRVCGETGYVPSGADGYFVDGDIQKSTGLSVAPSAFTPLVTTTISMDLF